MDPIVWILHIWPRRSRVFVGSKGLQPHKKTTKTWAQSTPDQQIRPLKYNEEEPQILPTWELLRLSLAKESAAELASLWMCFQFMTIWPPTISIMFFTKWVAIWVMNLQQLYSINRVGFHRKNFEIFTLS